MRAFITVVGAAAVAVHLRNKANRADRLRSITQHYGALIQAEAQQRARQLFDETDYPDTIKLRVVGSGDEWRAIIRSDAPHAHRLEYGFTGVDELGRHVHQPPRPHIRPAYAKYAKQYRKAVEDIVK